ncbi:MAG: nodulation protein NfeD, partial [Desulfurococcales archaeon ex4484_217_2]
MKNKRISKITIFLLIALLLTAISIVEAETYAGPKVYVFRFDGKIINQGLATALINALDKAESENAILLLIIDTPGGELDATEQIAKAILNSAIPVVGYVYPRGATAW